MLGEVFGKATDDLPHYLDSLLPIGAWHALINITGKDNLTATDSQIVGDSQANIDIHQKPQRVHARNVA